MFLSPGLLPQRAAGWQHSSKKKNAKEEMCGIFAQLNSFTIPTQQHQNCFICCPLAPHVHCGFQTGGTGNSNPLCIVYFVVSEIYHNNMKIQRFMIFQQTTSIAAVYLVAPWLKKVQLSALLDAAVVDKRWWQAALHASWPLHASASSNNSLCVFITEAVVIGAVSL